MSLARDRFVRRLERIERHGVASATQPRLPYSAIDGGAVTLKTHDGEIRGFVGEQWDGTTTSVALGGTAPPAPTAPLVTPKQGGLALYWDGTFADDSLTRMDWKRVTFHAVTDPEAFDPLDPSRVVGEISIAVGGEVFAALLPVEHFVFAVAWTDAGKFSEGSTPVAATPLSLIDAEEWQQHEEALTDLNEVKLPALQDELTTKTATIDSTLAGLRSDLDLLEQSDGEVSDLVALINRSTSTRHGIY